ncbi:F510_1955 family glycosylhydrolase [Bacillus sp. B1-b2]|uniref:F510_1955 family glycosylhydrolase n=1 Tax=Bacillus sp. B1-b2 TaxID=2653201 RepID=UPI001261C51F|nr:hypothetical protein [Bacillus sp. B1-b2]KAB7666937.1 hypothetical protein F9279_16900 [Bacillus sp. B1-b2]
MKKIHLLVVIIGLAFAVAACNQSNETQDVEQEKSPSQNELKNTPHSNGKEPIESNSFFTSFDGTLEHIHGLGYAGNQNAVFFAAHDGLKVFKNGKWYRTKTENNDYMGFNAVQKGFYSSGHPGKDSALPNPLGIKRSFDNGQSLENLTLEGETDFHVMGVGFENNVIYAISPQKNSLMDGNKLYKSDDNTKTWKKVAGKGLGYEIFSLTVHPTEPNIVASVGKDGVYLSEDNGENFHLISNDIQGTAVFLTNDHLIYGGYKEEAQLIKRSLTKDNEQRIFIPELKEDAIMYLAQNPQSEKEMVFSTFNGNIYRTVDGTKSWDLLVQEGELQTKNF